MEWAADGKIRTGSLLLTTETPPPPSVSASFTFELRDEEGVGALYCALDPALAEQAAMCVAKGIAQRRIGVNARLHSVWLEQLDADDGTKPKATDATVLVAGLLQNVGTPAEPADVNHLHGLVAEEIWFQLVSQRDDLGMGLPIHVEGHDWSATDPGGDGLTVYAVSATFAFRLWESKFHDNAAPVRDTVHGACRQMRDRATSYLARFSLVAQRLTDNPPLADFYSRLPEMWVDRTEAVGVGVVVAAGADPGAPSFSGMPSYFGLVVERHQGQLNLLGDCAGFCTRVQQILWKGCGLWNAP